MRTADIVVVGSGIAGVSVAHHLAAAGVRRVTLIEREPLLASHATARNAAIFLPVERGATSSRLAARQAAILDALFEGEAPWLRRTGALLVSSRAAPILALAAEAAALGLRREVVDRRSLVTRVGVLEGGDASHALLVPDSGVIDGHAVITALLRSARAHGVVVRASAGASRVIVRGGRVVAVALDDGSTIACGEVVLAGGAWSEAIGATCGAALPLTPLRRHLAWLAGGEGAAERWPIVWSLDDEVYFRPESSGVLASPCDEEAWPAGVPVTEPRALEALARKLTRLAPALATAPLRRAWACLRTFAPDRMVVAGRDPRVEGLSWVAGLGGQGMTVGVAAAEVTAASVLGHAHADAEALSPSRLVARRG